MTDPSTWLVAGAFALALASSPLAGQDSGPTGGEALLVEAAGGVVGSLAGIGLGYAVARPDQCDGEDLSCVLDDAAVILLTSLAGAAAGSFVAGRIRDTEPSVPGTLVGGLAGALAGLGVIKLIDEASSGGAEGVPALLAFSFSEGVVTALGSRAFAALR